MELRNGKTGYSSTHAQSRTHANIYYSVSSVNSSKNKTKIKTISQLQAAFKLRIDRKNNQNEAVRRPNLHY